MTTIHDWRGRTGGSWAAEWQRTDRSFGSLTDQLLARASERPLKRVLDIGCGAGETSLALARGHPGAQIRGIDISADLIARAQERGANLFNLSFIHDDAATWSDPDYAPDLIVSRHGVMFFPDPVASFAHLAATAGRDARLVFSCFRSLEENPWAERVESFLPAGSVIPPDRGAPGPFAFADSSHVGGILQNAGWRDMAFEPVDYAYIAGTGDDAVDDALSYFLSIGPAARAAAELDDEARTHFTGRLRRYLANNENDGLVALHASAWIVSARLSRR